MSIHCEMGFSLKDKIRSVFARKAATSQNAQAATRSSENNPDAPADVQTRSRQVRKRSKSRWVKLFAKKSRPARVPPEPQFGRVSWSTKTSCHPAVSTNIADTNREHCYGLDEIHQLCEPSHPQAQASEKDEGYGDELEESDDSDGKIEYKEVTEHDRCDWSRVSAIPHHAFARLVQKDYYSVGVAVAARETHRTKGAFNLVVFVNVLFSDRTTAKVIVRVPANGQMESKHNGHQKMRT